MCVNLFSFFLYRGFERNLETYKMLTRLKAPDLDHNAIKVLSSTSNFIF